MRIMSVDANYAISMSVDANYAIGMSVDANYAISMSVDANLFLYVTGIVRLVRHQYSYVLIRNTHCNAS